MLERSLLERVLAEALARGGDWAEVFVEDRISSSLRLEESRIEDVASGRDRGAGIRVVSGERASYAYTNLLREDALLETARAARAGLESPSGTVDAFVPPNSQPRHPVAQRPEEVDTQRKADALRAADAAARDHSGEVRQVIVSLSDVRQRVQIASSDGRLAEDDRTRMRFVAQVVAARDELIQTGHYGPGHSGGFELLTKETPEAIGRKAATRAVTMLDAHPSPAGEFPVVLAPGAGGVLIHEACGHGLEADTLAKDASVYAGRKGQRFGSEAVTIVDDGTDLGKWGSYGVDDEGTVAQRTVLFDEGVLVGHISDRRSAAKIGSPPTGNGRRQSYRHLPIARMTNTYLLPGSDDPAEILASIDRGVYAATFAGGEVNPATGNFVFGMSEAYMIHDGELAYPIRGANLIGNGPQVLEVVDAIGGDFDTWVGVCGKDGQSAPVTTGMGAVLLGKMTVGGTET